MDVLMLIKPDAFRRGISEQVLCKIIERHDVTSLHTVTLTGGLLDEHYAEHVSKPFYPQMREAMVGHTAQAIIVTTSSIARARKTVDMIRDTMAEPGMHPKHENLVHCSDSEGAAEREIALWFPGRTMLTTQLSTDYDVLAQIVGSEAFLRAVGSN